MNEEEYFQHPLIARYALAMRAINIAADDPEDTILLSLTERQMCLILLSLMVATRLFPELGPWIDNIAIKFDEVAGAQGKFGFRSDSGDDFGG